MSERAPLTFEEALSYVTRLGRFGIKLGLERSQAILDGLGNPERGLRGALIAGTNGKGSTAAYLASILRAGGHHVGTTPSPHLRSYTERVQVDGRPMTEAEFAAAVAAVQPRLQAVWDRLGEPTEFELLIGLAVWWLAPRVDRLVVEVGMGGRLDSTNVLDLGCAVITNVDLDHMQYLGDTVEAIAGEKAGIVKPQNLVVTGATGSALRVVEHRAREVGAASLWRLGQEITYEARSLGWSGSELSVRGPGFEHQGLHVPLLGSWQPENAALAVAAAHACGDATGDSVRQGLAQTSWPGRMQLVDGRLLLDGGHNPSALRRVVPAVRELAAGRPLGLVLGVMADKDLPPMLEELRQLAPVAVVTTATSAGGRALSPTRLATAWGPGAEPVLPAHDAVRRAQELAGPESLVLACGSLYLVGELLPPSS